MPTCSKCTNFCHYQSTSISWQIFQSLRMLGRTTYWGLDTQNLFKLSSAEMFTHASTSGTPSFAKEGKWWRQVWKSLVLAHSTWPMQKPSRQHANSRLLKLQSEFSNSQRTPGRSTQPEQSTQIRFARPRTWSRPTKSNQETQSPSNQAAISGPWITWSQRTNPKRSRSKRRP